MKKTLAVVLAVIMMLSCFTVGFGVFAVDEEEITPVTKAVVCNCTDCVGETEGKCHCCIACPYLDKRYVTDCVVFNADGTFTFCCDNCTGIWPCKCGHECCRTDETIDDPAGEPILTPGQQQSVISGFQNLMKIFTSIFDRLFNAVLEFLRIGDAFPDINLK